jgi:predicted esterase
MFSSDNELAHIKWVLPHAYVTWLPQLMLSLLTRLCAARPTKPVTANFGMEMPSWFDIYSFGFDSKEDEAGMLQTRSALNALISDEVDNGTPPERVILGGFSQGAAMSLLTGLTGERKLGGVVCLSGWLPLREKFKAVCSYVLQKRDYLS